MNKEQKINEKNSLEQTVKAFITATIILPEVTKSYLWEDMLTDTLNEFGKSREEIAKIIKKGTYQGLDFKKYHDDIVEKLKCIITVIGLPSIGCQEKYREKFIKLTIKDYLITIMEAPEVEKSMVWGDMLHDTMEGLGMADDEIHTILDSKEEYYQFNFRTYHNMLVDLLNKIIPVL